MVQYQATYWGGKGSETEKLGTYQIPHRDCQIVLEQHLQGGGHYRPREAAGTRERGEGQHHQFSHGHGKFGQGAFLGVLCVSQWGGTARCGD